MKQIKHRGEDKVIRLEVPFHILEFNEADHELFVSIDGAAWCCLIAPHGEDASQTVKFTLGELRAILILAQLLKNQNRSPSVEKHRHHEKLRDRLHDKLRDAIEDILKREPQLRDLI